MGVKYEARVREVAEQAIRKAAQTKDNPADLINVALEELVRQRCELPGYTTLDLAATSGPRSTTGSSPAVAGRIGRWPGRLGGCWWWTRRPGAASSTG